MTRPLRIPLSRSLPMPFSILIYQLRTFALRPTPTFYYSTSSPTPQVTMANSCCVQFAKFILIFINFIFLTSTLPALS